MSEQLYKAVSVKERLPEEGGMYFVNIGPLKDVACWTRSKILERVNEGLKELEWLEPAQQPHTAEGEESPSVHRLLEYNNQLNDLCNKYKACIAELEALLKEQKLQP